MTTHAPRLHLPSPWPLALRGLVALALLGWARPARADCDTFVSPGGLEGQLEDGLALAYYLFEPERAVEAYLRAEASLGCMAEVASSRELARLYLWLGSVYLDLGQGDEAVAAVSRAASVSAGIQLAEPTLSQRVRLLYLESLNSARLKRPATLRLDIRGGARIALDGAFYPRDPLLTEGGGDGDGAARGAGDGEGEGDGAGPSGSTPAQTLTLVPGMHFVQLKGPGGWIGRWVALPEGSAHVLSVDGGGVILLPDGAEAPGVGRAEPPLGEGDRRPQGIAAGRWALALAGAAALAGGTYVYEEALYRSGALIGPDGPVDSYTRHYYVHGASGVGAVTFSVGAAGAGILWWARRGRGDEGGEGADVAISMGPRGVSFSGRW